MNPDISLLSQVLAYDPDTGVLSWKVSRGRCKAGTVAGNLNPNGYFCIKVFNSYLKAHRIAWALHYGAWPVGEIDHIDRNRSNNRIENLRVASRSENERNKTLQINNTSGVKGVRLNKRSGKWHGYIKHNGSMVHVGYFSERDLAIDAVRRRREELHGEFANHGFITAIGDGHAD